MKPNLCSRTQVARLQLARTLAEVVRQPAAVRQTVPMCGRYVMARAIGDLVAEAGAVDPEEGVELRTSWNIAPTTEVAVVLDRPDDAGEIQREVRVARWGLVPPWAKDPAVGSRAFNARSETVVEKPTFRAAVKARRCAIPAEGYYEWLKPGPGAPKTAKKRPFFIHPSDGKLIFFAGLYEWWKDDSLPDGDPQQWLLSCTILTGPSPEPGSGDETLEELAGLHDRMPLPMDGKTMETWLEPGKLESAEEAGLLVEKVRGQAFETASAWKLHEVDPAVGNVRNNGPELIEPLNT